MKTILAFRFSAFVYNFYQNFQKSYLLFKVKYSTNFKHENAG
jgi:hypothetical protein